MRVLKNNLVLTLAVGVGSIVVACQYSPLATGLPDELPEGPNCMACHGNVDNAAPPGSLTASEEPSEVGVGAHQAHLRDGETRAAIACEECHPVPETVDAAGHLDPGPADVAFGPLATTGGVDPSWQRDSASCANTYCHGAGLSGGKHTEPIWTTTDRSQAGCQSCHGAPPPAPHPALSNCWTCHQGVVNDDGTIDIENGLHLNGEVDATVACNDCHGFNEDGAPPKDLDGSEETGAIGVGAHDIHLSGGILRGPVECQECHQVPLEVGDAGHLFSARPAEVSFGPLAMNDGAFPIWDRNATPPTCDNVYCHGGTLEDGTNTAPAWTVVDGTEATCGSCHSLPPPLPHPDVQACEICHAGTVVSSGVDPITDAVIDVDGGLHINGVVNVPDTCNGCHGDADSAAPPQAVDGSTDTAEIGVGAHRTHVEDGPLRAGLTCDTCHIVPLAVLSVGHIDDLPAEVTFGGLASTRGESPLWNDDPADLTCTNVYCHGASLGGGAVPAPVWTTVDGTQAACGSCHSLPPPAPHPQATECSLCHPQTVVEGTDPPEIDISSGTHINGEVTFF